ncbi:hypothetical protein vseg_003187 [Gypsophila vaccaria]
MSNIIRRIKTINPRPPIFNSTTPLKSNHLSRHFHKFTPHLDDTSALQELLNDVESRRKARALASNDDDEEDEDDYAGVGSLIEKLDGHDCDRDDDDDDVATEDEKKGELMTDMLWMKHQLLLHSFCEAVTSDDAFDCMTKIHKFEEKHFHLLPEYRVIAQLSNRFKDSTGKHIYPIAQKLDRALRLLNWKQNFNPDNPASYRVIQQQEYAGGEVDEDETFDEMNERDDVLLEKVHSIGKKLEDRLAALEYAFGKKEKGLEEETKDLGDEGSSLMEGKKRPINRKGFDVQLIDVRRTSEVTKGGKVVNYTAVLACGNYNGVVGYAEATGPTIPIALQKAYEPCFQNLHYVDRYEDHTIAHPTQTTYKKTKVYLWPAKTTTGIKASRTVRTILHLAGFKNVKSKVVGLTNALDTVQAVFQALNAIETPNDVQENFGTTVG